MAGLLDRLNYKEHYTGNGRRPYRGAAAKILSEPWKRCVKRPNGLLIGRYDRALGVVGVIYEARPNVTSDVFALCFKTGNAVIKGGSDAIYSNITIADIFAGSSFILRCYSRCTSADPRYLERDDNGIHAS